MLLQLIDDVLAESEGLCFTGRLTRLVNVLSGFYPDIEITIGINEQISNRLTVVRNRCSGDDVKVEFEKELIELGIPEEERMVWLEDL